jgi:hypothetical protein
MLNEWREEVPCPVPVAVMAEASQDGPTQRSERTPTVPLLYEKFDDDNHFILSAATPPKVKCDELPQTYPDQSTCAADAE